MNLTILNFAFLLTFLGSVSQSYSLLLQPLTWGNKDSILTKILHLLCAGLEHYPLCVFVINGDRYHCIAVLFFSPAPLSNPVIQKRCFRPRELVRLPLPERSDRMSWWRKQSPSHISAPRNKTGSVVAWAFLWQSYQLMQSSPRFTLYYFGIYSVSHIKGAGPAES